MVFFTFDFLLHTQVKEFEKKINQIVYVSATPAKYEIEKSSNNIIEQIIRPTGLVDPQIEVRPAKKQIDNVLIEINKTIQKKEKVLITTLTKRMSEELTAYFKDLGLRIEYMHSDIHTLERIEIIKKLRSDKIDVLVGINLLREGLDIPEVSLVIILDADKEGFLRSATSLIQMFGRASRNLNGRVIMYAEEITESMKVAIQESSRRREKQLEFNKKNKITPRSIKKKVDSDISSIYNIDYHEPDLDKYLTISPHEISSEITRLKKQMDQLSKKLQFEEAARVRDQIKKLRKLELTFAGEIA